jgi:DNA-binding LacI/PurR family transcriptional regulator
MPPEDLTGKEAHQHTVVTLKQLAAHLGLSQSTVSRVMNQSAATHRIADKTQQRILAAAKALRYKPNAFASGLRKKRSFTIGVLVPEISEGYPTAILGGIEDALLREGFFYFIVSHRHRKDLLREYPHLLIARGVEGMIAVDSSLEEKLPLPVVAISGPTNSYSAISIELDHKMAARLALEHLQKLAHSRIAFIKGQGFSSDTKPRWQAIRSVAEELGIQIDPKLIVQLGSTGLGTEPGYIATLKLLARKQPFTAIFAFNDLTAIGAITALHEAGIHVPENVSVIGFDDIPSASTNNPALTTVQQPLREMGRIAAIALLERIRSAGEDTKSPHPSIRVLPTFRERQSTCAVVSNRRHAD